MNKEKLSQAVGAIDTRYIAEAAEPVPAAVLHVRPKRFLGKHRAAACLCIALLTVFAAFSTALAASEPLRSAVIAVFMPSYSGSEIKQIDEGHKTGSFDKEDVLFTFLDKFNNEKMEPGLEARKDGGYHYKFLPDEGSPEKAVVDCSQPDKKLLVTMELKPYSGTAGLWQVTSYQVISSKAAQAMVQ